MKNMKIEHEGRNHLLMLFIGVSILLFLLPFGEAVTITSFSSSPEKVAPGQSAQISLEIENTLKEDVEELNVALDFSQVPFAPFSSSSEQSIERLREDESEEFLFKIIVLPEAKTGVYKIPVRISYIFEEERKEKIGLVSLVVHAEPHLSLSSEGFLIQGEESKILVKVINDGLSDVKFVSIETTESGVSPRYEYLGNLDSDDFDSVEYSVFVGDVSSLQVAFTLRYKDAVNKDLVQTEVLSLPVYSRGEAQKLGLIEKPNYLPYLGILLVILLFVLYRIRRRLKKRRVQG